MIAESMAVTLLVTQTLERLGVPYFVGGSLASTFHGSPRTTLDTDIVAELRSSHVARLLEELGPDFYSDEHTIRQAIRARRSFNLIHIPTAFKVDVFIPQDRPFEREQMKRRCRQVATANPRAEIYLASPEDIILAKLDRYRQGGMVSERQWNDVLGVVSVQGSRLAVSYLKRWATALKVTDLLRLALATFTH